MKSKKGFTLVEMMLVVAIIVILSAVGIIAIGDTIKKSKDKQEEYKTHIDSMAYAQGNVKNIMANQRNANLPSGSAKPAEPAGDNGTDQTTPGDTNIGDETSDDKTPADETPDDEKTNGGSGTVGGGLDKTQDPEEKVEEPADPGQSVTPGTVTPASGTTTSAVNYWNKRDGYSDGSFQITTEKGVSEMVIVVPSGVKIKNLDYRYSQKINDDGTVTITYTADQYQTKTNSFNLQFEANMKEIPEGTFIVVSYK